MIEQSTYCSLATSGWDDRSKKMCCLVDLPFYKNHTEMHKDQTVKNLVNDLKKNHGEHLHEIGLQNLVNNKNDLIFHNNISDCIVDAEIIYITVPTPSKLDGSFSNEVIIQILVEIAKVIRRQKKSKIININSTVQPGSIEGETFTSETL